MSDQPFELNVAPASVPSSTVIRAQGALVLDHLFKFQEAWRGAQGTNLIFDLTGVNYMDSSAIGSLVNAHVSCSHRGTQMALVGVNERVKQILTITKVASLFKFYDDLPVAETAVGQAQSVT